MLSATHQGWHSYVPDKHPASALLSAAAVRQHCAEIAAYVQRGESAQFTWHDDKLDAVASYVVATIRERYPTLKVPYHSRWRHFEAGGVERWSPYNASFADDTIARVKARIDLVIPSVLLDAGAGAKWRYHDAATGLNLTRSEGLGVASLALFASGVLSDNLANPLRADAAALAGIGPLHIAKAFQVSAANPLVGLEGRAALLSRLGEVAAATPAVFGTPARLGNLFDYLCAHAPNRQLDAGFILATLLRALGPMWPARVTLEGVALGDCWPHSASSSGYVAFHKLSQWLCYSLLEPLMEAGLTIINVAALTGLPEYRNGGLLLDMGLIEARDATFHSRKLRVDEAAVIEWRALTVVALDALAILVRQKLNLTESEFPLACVLEGGTWAAGRKIAAALREGGPPPVDIDSDGTVF
jgi:Protein of unknown function (DUF1688)